MVNQSFASPGQARYGSGEQAPCSEIMGTGQVVTLRLQPEKPREVNVSIEKGTWGGFRAEFHPASDYMPVRGARTRIAIGAFLRMIAGKAPKMNGFGRPFLLLFFFGFFGQGDQGRDLILRFFLHKLFPSLGRKDSFEVFFNRKERLPAGDDSWTGQFSPLYQAVSERSFIPKPGAPQPESFPCIQSVSLVVYLPQSTEIRAPRRDCYGFGNPSMHLRAR